MVCLCVEWGGCLRWEGFGGGLHQEQGKTQLRSQSPTQLETITGIM